MTDVNLSSTDDAEKPAGHDVADPVQDPSLDDATNAHEAAARGDHASASSPSSATSPPSSTRTPSRCCRSRTCGCTSP